jgi:putative endonuclease
MRAFVYILLCADRSYYVGSAPGEDLAPRISQHNSGFYGGYTSTRRPVRLAWSQRFEQITDAIAAERQLKGWSRAKKEALICGDWNSIQSLAKRCRQTEKFVVMLAQQKPTYHRHPEAAAKRALEG